METAKKEIILAIVTGLAVGVIATFILSGAYKSLNIFKKRETSTVVSLIPSTAPNFSENEFLDININNNNVFSKTEAPINGKCKPNCLVLISTENEDKIINGGKEGLFSTTINLENGTNQILFTLLNSKEEITKEYNLFYFP